ncbi:MAG: PilX N-terminal domain-containing pilus assembly protein [Pseudomonadota bacterium]
MHRQSHLLTAQRQSGAALAVALILLILVTLIGLAAIRGVTGQQRMTANFYDREVGFQSAEAALRAGENAVVTGTGNVRPCIPGGEHCQANPFTDPTLNAGRIQTVATGDYQAGSNAPGQPQFVVELICNDCQTAGAPASCQSANCGSYGAQTGAPTTWYYRITARSGDPAAAGGNRAIVTLQSMYAAPPN